MPTGVDILRTNNIFDAVGAAAAILGNRLTIPVVDQGAFPGADQIEVDMIANGGVRAVLNPASVWTNFLEAAFVPLCA